MRTHDSWNDYAFYACPLRTRHHFSAVCVELGSIQMAVRIDQHKVTQAA